MAIAYTISQEEWDILPSSSRLEACTKYIQENISSISNGDVLLIADELAFWSTTKGLLLPDFEVGNESGTVPSDFRVGNGTNEFHATHWMNVDGWDEYDGHIWPSHDLISEINTLIVKNMEGTYSCEVLIREKTFKIESAVPDPTMFELMSNSLIVSFE